ncbi:MAG: UDP-N-acetylmuramate--L-alanine ligase, partial [Anaerolineae bacterium]|nr:UDP-N-acetylmuramate--L-alanine ligase [Anaerolineae bacterium]
SQTMRFIPGQRVHIIGIGGTGMSAIARVLLRRGVLVSGSDMNLNEMTSALEREGATIYKGHTASNISGADALIATSAVPDSHVEIAAARQKGIPVYRRSDVMGALMVDQVGIAVAGTHGKTTTTSMIVHILKSAGHDPTYIVGGVMANTGTNAEVGDGKAFVIEADEYGHMFHGLRPRIALLTSVEWDHPDFFPTPQTLQESFMKFVNLLPEDGVLVACVDDAGAANIAQKSAAKVITYGTQDRAQWRAVNIQQDGAVTQYNVEHEGASLGEIQLAIPGQHNVLNSLAALIVAHNQGISFKDAAAALASFRGAGRRFDLRSDTGEIAVIDDYAHHPTAIRVTLEAARSRYPDREIWAIWQPHTYSRTKQLWHDFLTAFAAADHVLVTEVYAARETDTLGIRSADFVEALAHESKFHAPTLTDAVEILEEAVKAPAAILILSAGDAPQIGIDYLSTLGADAR